MEIDKEILIEIVSKCTARTFCDELEFISDLTNQPIDWLVAGLRSSLDDGIYASPEGLQWRQTKYGSNKKNKKELPTFFQLFCDALQDFTLRILIVASFLSIAIEVGTASEADRSHAWIQGFAILMAVFICATVAAVNDYQKQRQFVDLNQVCQSRKTVTIKRNGVAIQIHHDFLFVGDIIQLNEGMEIPADGFLIASNQITTDQSAMTGQSQPVAKNTFEKCVEKSEQIIKNGQKNECDKRDIPSPIMLSGTKILTGQGKMIVIVVGDSSCYGKISALLNEDQAEPTPLQMKLEVIAQDIGKFGLYSAILIIMVLLIRFTIEKGMARSWNTATDLAEILNYFILGITVVVVAIPEGLPLAVTLSLAFSVKKMLTDQNLVRRMQACETMGGANIICSDKTGTLTMNKMTLVTYWNQNRVEFDHYKQVLTLDDYMKDNFAELFKLSLIVNSSAILKPEPKGSSTEIAFLNLMVKMGIDYQQYRQDYAASLKFPFNSNRKRMSSVITYRNQKILLIKGASQIVLQSCECWYNQSTNKVEEITEKTKQTMKKVIEEMAMESLRTLCIAYKSVGIESLQDKDQKGVFEIQKCGMILLAILGVKDIPRPEVPEAIKKCKTAGIKIKMVTGDNKVTAQAIAKQIGIIENQEQDLVMEGIDFYKLIGGVVCKECHTQICQCQQNMINTHQGELPSRIDVVKNMQAFKKISDRLTVLARSRPEDKYALVCGLKQLGNVVAVTGDGTNDAPALKKADVGFAMGICGSQVAREAASIILLDDNFNSIVKAVIWGRNIYDSIKKFIQFQLTVNLAAVGITLLGAAILKQEVLKPIQMLWLNLIMDTLASLALATQPPSQQLLNRNPHCRNQYIISKRMFKHIILQSIFQLFALIVMVFWGQLFIPESADGFDAVIGKDLSAKYHHGIAGSTICSGRLYYLSGGNDYQAVFLKYHVYSRHFTFVFNAFVMMQVFNFLNCRKLQDQINIFAKISNNPLFIMIVVFIFILQAILVTFGSIAFGVYSYYGLNLEQWLLSIGIGALSLVINLVAKFIPEDKIFIEYANKEKNPLDTKSVSMSLKRKTNTLQRNISLNNNSSHNLHVSLH